MSGPTIFPTHTCFDDALDYVTERLKNDPRCIEVLSVVHGICLIPVGTRKDEPYAHAWVEERRQPGETTLVWQGGILRDMGPCEDPACEDAPKAHDHEGARVFYAVTYPEFADELRPQKFTRYSVREAARENARTNHFGPWLDEYLALCKPKDEPRVAFGREDKP